VTPTARAAISAAVVLDADVWRAREQAHAERADALTAGRRARATLGERHPIEDFLFTYYAYSPSLLRRWHPGAGVELADAASTPRAGPTPARRPPVPGPDPGAARRAR